MAHFLSVYEPVRTQTTSLTHPALSAPRPTELLCLVLNRPQDLGSLRKRSTRHRREKPKLEIRLLTAIKVTQVQIIRCEHACMVPCVACGSWSLFIGTFRGSGFARSASQNTTTSTVVTTIVEKEHFF